MKLSKDAQELAEMKYQFALQRLAKEYRKKKDDIRLRSLTETRENLRLLSLLPERLEKTADALITNYLEAFALDRKIPEHDDLVELDRKIESIFGGGHGDETGSLPIGIVHEIQALEKQACDRLRFEAKQMKLQSSQDGVSTLTMNIHGDNYGNIQQGGERNIQSTNESDHETR